MKNEQAVREQLIRNTIMLIAEGGFEHATTRAITQSGTPMEAFRMNDVYIYRLFGGKEQLYYAAFCCIHKEILAVLEQAAKACGTQGADARATVRVLVVSLWQYAMKNHDKVLCYLQYYYSPYYQRQSLVADGESVTESLRTLLARGTDVALLLQGIIFSVLHCVVREDCSQPQKEGILLERISDTLSGMIKDDA